MHGIPAKTTLFSILNIHSVAHAIAALQRPNGDIPWHIDGKTDPWDLVESAMGLNIAGNTAAARRCFDWLAAMQNDDGSWFSAYMDSEPQDQTRESHMACYLAVGLLHSYLITGDAALINHHWATLERGIEFALDLQTETGEIYWARSPQGKADPMSLLSGSSSIFMSLKAALTLARILKISRPAWEQAWEKLGHSLNDRLHVYNMSKSRFSMYWFYPILAGAICGDKAQERIERYWNKYIIEGQGCRCVSDQPWVTIAETCELVLALDAMGEKEKARIVFSWIQDRTFEDKTFWCGYTYPDMVIWPEEKISWTNAVALMAADALYELTPAAALFHHSSWDGPRLKALG